MHHTTPERAFQASQSDGAGHSPSGPGIGPQRAANAFLRESGSGSPAGRPAWPRAGAAPATDAAAGDRAGRQYSRYYREKDGGVRDSSTYGGNTSNASLSAWMDRVVRYGKAKSRQTELADWMAGEVSAGRSEGSMLDRLNRLRGCGGYLVFRQFVTLPDEPIKLAAASFCKQDRLCQMCAIRRSVKLLRAYVPKLSTLVGRGLVPYFVTFTAKNGPDLVERFKHHEAGLRALLREAWNVRKGRVKGSVPGLGLLAGAVFSYEFKRGAGLRGGLWHPHAHGVFLSEGPLPDDVLLSIRQRWCELMGDADVRGQDIRRLAWAVDLLEVTSGNEAGIEKRLVEQVGSDLVEVMKYPLKLTEMTPADQWETACKMRGRHLIRPWGQLRGVEVSEAFENEEFDAGDLPYLELLLRFGEGGYRISERRFIDKKCVTR